VIKKLAILSLGLMGGSLAAALKRANYAEHIVAWGRREASLQQGLALGIVDSITLSLDEAVKDADVVVVCSPTQVAEGLLIDIVPKVKTGAIITDVASVKGNLERALIQKFGEMPSNVVLGHPIAGAENSGVGAAKADLFDKHRIILTPSDNSALSAVTALCDMWQACGAEVETMTTAEHDAILAGTSHLPHLLAYTMVGTLADLPTSHDVFKFAAGGLRDFSRIAASDPQMWTEISLSNKNAILGLIQAFQSQLSDLTTFIENDDDNALMTTFAHAKSSRDYFSSLLEQQHS